MKTLRNAAAAVALLLFGCALLPLGVQLPAQAAGYSTALGRFQSFIAATNGGTSSLTCNQAAVFTHTSGIAGYTVNMPASPADGCWVSLATGFNITTLTMADPGGNAITSALTTITATTPTAWVFNAGTSRWYRCVACQ